MPHRAYVLINVVPGQTSQVIKLLSEIKEIKTIDACWGKPDIVALAEGMRTRNPSLNSFLPKFMPLKASTPILYYQFIR